MAQNRSRNVFVGNIPYELTEEQLVDIFKEVGPVKSFRLVFDRDTSKPRGYGFCEYYDPETASSALRVDYAESDPAASEGGSHGGGRGSSQHAQREGHIHSHGNYPGGTGHAVGGGGGVPVAPSPAQKFQSQIPSPSFHQATSLPAAAPAATGLPAANPIEAITQTLASMTHTQILDLLTQMKVLVERDPNNARVLLTQNPQAAYAMCQAILMLNLADPSVVQRIIIGQTAPVAMMNQMPPSLLSMGQPLQAPMAMNMPLGQPPQPFPTMGYGAAPGASVPYAMNPLTGMPMAMNPNPGIPSAPVPFLGGPQPVMANPSHPSVGAPQFNLNILPDQQKTLLLQVMNLTQEQIESLPLEQRQNIIQLKNQILRQGAM